MLNDIKTYMLTKAISFEKKVCALQISKPVQEHSWRYLLTEIR